MVDIYARIAYTRKVKKLRKGGNEMMLKHFERDYNKKERNCLPVYRDLN
jgi:hypothetical protein